MRAVGIETFGGPEVLAVVEVPTPEPGPGEIRVHVAAATVNPTDIGMREGARAAMFAAFEPPYVPGMELAGTIDAVGEGTTWNVGDEVMGIVVPQRTGRGAQSEYCVIPAGSAVPIPAGLSVIEAATIPMNGLTVRRAFDLMDPAAGETLLITGASGAVGGYGIEFGTAAGLTVIAVASPDDEAYIRSLGAAHFLARGDDLAARILEVAPGGVDHVLDAALIGSSILSAVRDHGDMAVVRPFAGETEREIVILGVAVGEYAESTPALDDLRVRAESGKLTTRVAATYPPERAGEAHERLAAGGVRGRLVITF